jgi:peptidyl-prolyl cis-trans isomerase C
MRPDPRRTRWLARRAVPAVLLGLAASLGVAVTLAQSAGDRVVARVGSATVSLDQLKRHLAQVPVFQLRQLGKTNDEVRRAFVDLAVVTELLVQGAQADHLDAQPEVADRLRSVLASAMVNDLRDEMERSGEVSDADVRAYYEAHKDSYLPQARIKISQVVVETRAKAEKILDTIYNDEAYAKDPDAGWDKLVQEESIDKSTKMRKGTLGFVTADGSTAYKDVRVPPAIFEAAAKVKDGQVYPEPVQLGDAWAVLWRRGSQQTPERTLELEAPTIRGILAKEKIQARVKTLLEELRAKHAHDARPEMVDQIEVSSQGDLAPRRRPGGLPRSHAAAASPKPQGEPGVLR